MITCCILTWCSFLFVEKRSIFNERWDLLLSRWALVQEVLDLDELQGWMHAWMWHEKGLFIFWDRVLHYRLCWSETYYINWAGLKLWLILMLLPPECSAPLYQPWDTFLCVGCIVFVDICRSHRLTSMSFSVIFSYYFWVRYHLIWKRQSFKHYNMWSSLMELRCLVV